MSYTFRDILSIAWALLWPSKCRLEEPPVPYPTPSEVAPFYTKFVNYLDNPEDNDRT